MIYRLAISFTGPVPVLLLLLNSIALAQFNHPRGIVSYEQLTHIRARLSEEPYRSMLATLERTGEDHLVVSRQETEYEPYTVSDRLATWAYLYLLTENPKWAEHAGRAAERILDDTVFFTNPLAKGLTRARLLQKLAFAYDFCYAAWPETRRKVVNDALFSVMYSVHSTMGYAANYSIESNWMGVRYGSVLLTSHVWDWSDTIRYKRSPALPIRWDATKRLQDHIQANIYSSGWNAESMSYHIYGWTFVGPALLALQNNLSSFSLDDFAPNALETLHALMTSTVAIELNQKKGMTPDLSDDDPMFSTGGVLAMGLSLYPPEQRPALKWMHDYLIDPTEYDGPDGQLAYSLLYYPDSVQSENPAESDWLSFYGEEPGAVVWRNRFQDENDIVAAYHAKASRVRGHQGPDTNTIRLLGLGVPWIIGAGRTGFTAGQSNFFPDTTETAERDDRGLGKLLEYQIYSDDKGGYAMGSGSAMGTQDHRRLFYVSYDASFEASGVFVVKDTSANGQRWRINTPEFNQIETQDDGFRLIAPTGASLKVTVLTDELPLKTDTGKLRYGGKTAQHNLGIIYQEKSYENSRYIDVYCDQAITVVMTLQPSGQPHPEVSEQNGKIRIGEKYLDLPYHSALLGSSKTE
ncbi:MAG: hypothetical protein ACFB15_12590 [Cyclobacteriaceae bacterium]